MNIKNIKNIIRNLACVIFVEYANRVDYKRKFIFIFIFSNI